MQRKQSMTEIGSPDHLDLYAEFIYNATGRSHM